MAESPYLDPLVLGRRIRHFRAKSGMTLDQLGDMVGKPGPYLSLLENGKKEPRLQLILDLASALSVDLQDLIDPSPPTRREHLEIALLRAQDSSLFERMDIPEIRPSAKLDDTVMAHIVGLHEALQERSELGSATGEEIRKANGLVTGWIAAAGGYLEDIEDEAARALATSGYVREGPFSSRNLIDLADSAGFEIRPIDDMPSFARSVIDLENQRIYIAQRNELKTRQARKAVLQTLAGFLLHHESTPDLEKFLRQRVETAYFAAAVLVPESTVIPRLIASKENHDLNPEDVKELFYVSYEMAAWRMANLVTRHLDIPTHLVVSSEAGTIVKGYSNDDAPMRRDEYGGLETQKLCQKWGTRVTFRSPDRFDTHHQYTDTPTGTYFCTTHIETGADPLRAVTLGVPFKDAKWFRGRDTGNRMTSTCPDPSCCRTPPEELSRRWSNKVLVSARAQERILGLMAPDPYPDLDMTEVFNVVQSHSI
ncbi:MAG TPA: helix-turn-helix domain-containing protein [Acidimicrobiia bacterium]